MTRVGCNLKLCRKDRSIQMERNRLICRFSETAEGG